MKACIFAVEVTVTGAATQVVSNQVRDKNGVLFTPTLVFVSNMMSALNSLASTGSFGSINQISWGGGVDTGTEGGSGSSIDGLSLLGIINNVSGVGGQRYSIIQAGAGTGPGDIYRYAYCDNFTLGGFTINFDYNIFMGDVIIFHAFAPDFDDVNFEAFGNLFSGNTPTSAKPQGILRWQSFYGLFPIGSKGAFPGAGFTSYGFGWATRDGNYGAIVDSISSNNWTYQRADYAMQLGVDNFGVASQGLTVTTWNDTSIDCDGHAVGSGLNCLAIIGDLARTAAGTITQRATPGIQRISFGGLINPIWLILQTNGYPATTSPTPLIVQVSAGFADNGNRQAGVWCGESGVYPAATGARYTSDETILRISDVAGINSGSTTFHSVARLVDLNRAGYADIEWLTTNGGDAEIQWFVIGSMYNPDTSSNTGKGIYKMIPDKLQDTLYVDYTNPTPSEILVKLPDPNIYTSLIGDE